MTVEELVAQQIVVPDIVQWERPSGCAKKTRIVVSGGFDVARNSSNFVLSE